MYKYNPVILLLVTQNIWRLKETPVQTADSQ